MVLVGHSQRLSEPLTRRQRRGLASVGAIVALIAVGVVVWLSTQQNTYAHSRNGCVYVVLAGPTGGEIVHQCGIAARAWCKTELGRRGVVASAIQEQCRLAGIDAPRSSRT